MKKLKDWNKPFKYIGTLAAAHAQLGAHAMNFCAFATRRKSDALCVCFVSSLLSAVTAVIMQKNGAGLHTATSCYWDNTTDGACCRVPPLRSSPPRCASRGGCLPSSPLADAPVSFSFVRVQGA